MLILGDQKLLQKASSYVPLVMTAEEFGALTAGVKACCSLKQ